MATTTVTRRRGTRGRKIKFGDVTITAPAPDRAAVRANVAFSTEALGRAVERLARPGVSLRTKKGVPLFSLDGDDPDIVIRTLDGRTERGRLIGGVFQTMG